MAKIKFTDAQEKVINHDGDNLLVFASAGSGKTAVIIQKIAQDLIASKISLDNLLVVTFTDAATNEMKQRLYAELAKNTDNNNVKQEIEKLPLADISTLHGFCQKLIKQYFFDLNIEPSFSVLSEEESSFLKIKALDQVLRQKQEKGDRRFFELCEMFFNNRSLSSLKENILTFYNFLGALDNKEEYLNNVATSCYIPDLKVNPASQYLKDKFQKDYLYFKSAFEKLLIDSEMAGEEKVSKAIEAVVENLNKKSFTDFEDMFTYFTLIKGLKSPFGSLRLDSDILAEARALWEEFKKMLEGLFESCGGETLEEISNNIIETLPAAQEFIDLTRAFEKEYTMVKASKKALDFDDLEKYALELLKNPTLCKAIQDKYKYIYVDEYQDINSKQEKILSCVTSGNNMIMVGDIKQSIYGFRNSSPQIFIDKTLLYKQNVGGRLITLNENFRSNPVILDFVNDVFCKVMKENFGGIDYKKDGKFKGSAKYKKVNSYKEVSLNFIDIKDRESKEDRENLSSQIYSVQDDDRDEEARSIAKYEAKVIASKIASLLDNNQEYYDAKQEVFKPLTYDNFTILCRSRAYIKELSMHLQALGVPVSSKTADNIYNNPDVLFLLNMLKVINNHRDDIALTAVLSSAYFGLSYDDLAIIRQASSAEYFYDCINEYRAKTDDIATKLNVAFELIAKLREQKDFATIYDLLTIVDRELGVLNYCLMLPGGRARYKLLADFIESFEGLEYNSDINEYLNYVDSYLKNIEVAITSPAKENCVHIDTIHSSKGLEYEIVFVAGLGKMFSNLTVKKEVLMDKDLGIGINDFDLEEHTKQKTLTKYAIATKIRFQEKLEEVRLLYVALTRAKNALNIVGSFDFSKIKTISEYDIRKSNKYIPWILSALDIPLLENIKNLEETDTFPRERYEVNAFKTASLDFEKKSQQKDNAWDSDDNIAKEILGYISFDYSHKECLGVAQKNTVTNIMRQETEGYESYNPEPKKLLRTEHNIKPDYDYAMMGTIYHEIMEALDFEKSSLEDINNYIQNKKISDAENAKYYDAVNPEKIQNSFKILAQETQGKTVYKERQFMSYIPYCDIIESSDIKERVLLQGVIDLLVVNGDSADIYDYKTTRVENPEQLVAKYGVQMKLYKLAAERAVGKPVKNVYIYSFWLDKLIKII